MLVYIVGALLTYVVIAFTRAWMRMRDGVIPGPSALPPLGNLLDTGVGLHNFHYDNFLKYGKVYRYWMFTSPTLVISDPILAKDVCLSRAHTFRNRPSIPSDRLALGNGLMVSRDEDWQKQRRLIQPRFMDSRIAAFADLMGSKIDILLNKWKAKEGTVVNIHNDLDCLALDILGESSFGLDFKAQESKRSPLQEAVASFFIDGGDILLYLIPGAHKLPTPKFKRLNKSLDLLWGTASKLVGERLKDTSKSHDDLLQLLIDAKDPKTGETLTEELIQDQVMNFLLGGFDTTTSAMTWTFYHLARHPDCLKTLRQEIDLVNQGKHKTCRDVKKLEYLEWVILESIRLTPVAHMLIREAAEDTVVGAYKVDKGTAICISTYNMQMDPDNFPEPEKFIPERHHEEGKTKFHPYANLPFGGGPHNCVGKSFAMTTIKMVISKVISTFDLTLAQDKPAEVFSGSDVICRPKDGVFLKMRSRA